MAKPHQEKQQKAKRRATKARPKVISRVLGARIKGCEFFPHGIWQPRPLEGIENLVEELENLLPDALSETEQDGLLIIYVETTFAAGFVPTPAIAGQIESMLGETLPDFLRGPRGREKRLATYDGGESERLLMDGLYVPRNAVAAWASAETEGSAILAEITFVDALREELWQHRLSKVNYGRLRKAVVQTFGVDLEPSEDHEGKGSVGTEFRPMFESRLNQIPNDFASILTELRRMQHDFRDELATQLEPAFNAYVRDQPQDAYDDKRRLATWMNEQLSSVGLALRCPKTGWPATIVADSNDASGTLSRFRIYARNPEGKRVRTGYYHELPEFKLMEAFPRVEGLSSWADKLRSRRQTDDPGESAGIRGNMG